MGIGRWLLKNTFGLTGHIVDSVIKVSEHGFQDGMKEKFREDFQEDNPITSKFYNDGVFDGKKEGYVEASNEYQKKLISQGEYFLKQANIAEEHLRTLSELLEDYEEIIEKLSRKLEKTEQEKRDLLDLMDMRNRLEQKLA